MNGNIIRLRVVVQRNGLPDEKFMLPMPVADDPTIVKLLEQTSNAYYPLESDQWGLEDYAVYRQAPDGSKFECLHFSSVSSIFRDDDQVLIRPLQTDDLRRRRIGGRYQISSDGKHLMDGVAFGRPLLKPANRPPIHIPPRKRRRLLRDEEEEDEDSSMLLLTNGPEDHDESEESEFTDEEDDQDFEADEQQSDNLGDNDDDNNDNGNDDDVSENDSEPELDNDELAEELQALREENAALEEGDDEEPEAKADPKPQHKQSLDLEALDKISALQAAFPSAPLDVCEKVLMASNGDLKEAYTTLSDGFPPKLSDTATLARAQPGVITKSSQPKRCPVANTSALALAKQRLGPLGGEEDAGSDGGDEAEPVSDFVRQYDQRGLPPGTISLENSASQKITFADSNGPKVNGDSEGTSATLLGSNESKSGSEKIFFDEEDETSSSGTSSSSSSEDEESEEDDDGDDEGDNASDESSEDDDDFAGGSEPDSDSDEARDSDDEGAQESASSDAGARDGGSGGEEGSDSDSGPEVATAKGGLATKSQASVQENSGVGSKSAAARTNNSDSTSDSSEEESSSDDTSSDDTSSDEDSSESESESGDDEDRQKNSADNAHPTKTPATHQPPVDPSTLLAQTAAAIKASKQQQAPVPPGHGKESTKSRNARRRAAQRAKRQAQIQAQLPESMRAETSKTTTPDTGANAAPAPPTADQALVEKQALFEAKRKALLDALANGGVEIDSRGEMVDNEQSGTDSQLGGKRKREEAEEAAARDQTPQETPVSDPASDSSQKRRRLDVGAGRRLLFGALGLRNPKGKEDAEKVSAKLMEGVRPLANQRLEQDKADAKEPDSHAGEQPEEDLDSWKDAITYRAVECCQEGVELSEPPFPFKQRWDPQQQNSWSHKNKAGGKGKRAERNQEHFYQEKKTSKKRKHDESYEWGGEGYDETFNGFDDESRNHDNIRLNYDDEVVPDQEMTDPAAEASQFTDIDDLPSLPKDLSHLPILRPGEVKPGMVITWKKWSCSTATNWQPQISDVTGVVVRTDDDATGVEVMLAKRDRSLDGNQKRYDPLTGQRIYDKFEAPDMDDDDDPTAEDEGYRTLSFAEMQEPRILQLPLPGVNSAKPAESQTAAPSENDPSQNGVAEAPEKPKQQVPTQPEEESHVTESSIPVVEDDRSKQAEESAVTPKPTDKATQGEEAQYASNSTDHQPGQGQERGLSADQVVSDMSRVSSPSRQLHESISQAADVTAMESSGYRGDIDTDPVDPATLLTSDPVPDSEGQAHTSGFDGDEDEVITGTPKAIQQRKARAASLASSIHSGRQVDYTMGEDENATDSLRVTEADDDAHAPLTDGGDDDPGVGGGDEGDVTTPTASPSKLFSEASGHPGSTPTKAAAKESPGSPSSPESLASINTLFCTAKTSRQTRSPSKSQQTVIEKTSSQQSSFSKNNRAKDLDYDAAMRKLDQQSADDREDRESSRIPDSFAKPNDNKGDSQMSSYIKEESQQLSLPKLRRGSAAAAHAKISPPPPKRAARKPQPQQGEKGKQQPSSQFTLPPGSQVIDLLSSSDAEAEPEPEPEFVEDYADEDDDPTYSPNNKSSSLPTGAGWVQKTSAVAALGRARNKRLGDRILSSSQPQPQTQGFGSQSASYTSSSFPSSLPELGSHKNKKGVAVAVADKGGRRKSSARF